MYNKDVFYARRRLSVSLIKLYKIQFRLALAETCWRLVADFQILRTEGGIIWPNFVLEHLQLQCNVL